MLEKTIDADLLVKNVEKQIIFIVALDTGLRIEEIMALTWSDVGLKKRAKKLQIELKGLQAPEEYENLVFVTKNNRPKQQFIVEEGISACVHRVQKAHPEFYYGNKWLSI